MKEIPICEYLNWGDRPMQVDATAGIIRGVKVLGLSSRNGRHYLEDALRQAVPLYEGAKVNVNHPQGGGKMPRDYRDRLGLLRNVHVRDGDGLFADLYFNPKHDVAERLVWDALHAPQNVGLSHNVLARVRKEGDAAVVYEITQVISVDVVADPASTEGLFESAPPDTPGPKSYSGETPSDRPAGYHEQEVSRLRAEIDLRRQLGRSLLAPPDEESAGRHRLGPQLWRVLLEVDTSRRKALLTELGDLLRSFSADSRHAPARPQSRDGMLAEAAWDPAAFARAITKQFPF